MYSPPRSKNPLGFGLGSEYGKPLPGERALLYPASYSPSSSTLSPLRFASTTGGGGNINNNLHNLNNHNMNPVTGNPLSPRAKLSPLPISNIIAANGALTTINNDTQNPRRKMTNLNGIITSPPSSSSNNNMFTEEYSSIQGNSASKSDTQTHSLNSSNGLPSENANTNDSSHNPTNGTSSLPSSFRSAAYNNSLPAAPSSSSSSLALGNESMGAAESTHHLYSTLANEALSDNILRAVSRMVDNRLAVEENVREGLAREIHRLRDRVNVLEITVKEKDTVNEIIRVKQATTEAEMRILRNDLLHTVNRIDSLTQSITFNNQNNNSVSTGASMSPPLTLATVFNDATFRNVANQAREAFDLVEHEIRTRAIAEDTLSNRLSIINRNLTELQQQSTAQAFMVANNTTPSANNSSLGNTGSMGNPMATPTKGTFSPPTSPTTRNFHRFQHSNTNHHTTNSTNNDDMPHIPMIARSAAEAAMMDPGDDPSLYANRVVTRSILETYLSGLRSQIESESHARKSEIDHLTADYAARLDRAVGEIAGFRGLVREEVTSRVDSVVDAVTTAVSELATKATAASVSIGSLTAAFNEEKQWSRDDSALLRDMINKRCNSIEEVIRVQAQARTKKEQALGDAIIRGLQQEQHNRELGNNGISNRLHDIHTTIENLRNNVVNNSTEAASALVAVRDELVQTVDVRMNRIDNDLQITVNNFMDRHERTENSIRNLSSQTDERLQKMVQDVNDQRITTEQLFRNLDNEVLPSRLKDMEINVTNLLFTHMTEQKEQFTKQFADMQENISNQFQQTELENKHRTEECILSAIKEADQRNAENLSTVENDIQSAIETLGNTQTEDRNASLATIMMLTEEIKSTASTVNGQFDTWSNRILSDITTWQEELQKEIDNTMDTTVKSIKTHNNHLRELQHITQEHSKSLHDMAIVLKEGFKLSDENPVIFPIEEGKVSNSNDGQRTVTDRDEHAAAATKIQAIARGRQARTEVQAMKSTMKANDQVETIAESVGEETMDNATKDSSADADAAATKIQAIARGRQARTEVQAMKSTMNSMKANDQEEEEKEVTLSE